MSVKAAQSYLTIFEDGSYLNFLKELVYGGIQFEVLNPTDLSPKWAEVEFPANRSPNTSQLDKIDNILNSTKKKGLFAALVDTRPIIKLDDVKKFNLISKRSELVEQVDCLSKYIQQRETFNQLMELSKKFGPDKSIVVGQHLLSYKEQLDTFGFKKNIHEHEIHQNIPEIDFVSFGDLDSLIFANSNLDYVLSFEKSATGSFNLTNFHDFAASQQENLNNQLNSLKALGCDPDLLSSDKYKQFCILYSDLELENILIQSEKLVFALPHNKSEVVPNYAFISVHSDYCDKFQKIAEANNLALQKVDWNKEIVVWQQNQTLNPFRAVAESLGTINTKQSDPSILISFFFSLFFAFCLGDALYGLFLCIFCGYFLFFKRLKPQFENIFRLFFISGIATVVFGALLNSWAGDLFVKTPLGPTLENIQLINPLDPNANLAVNRYLLSIGVSPIVALLGLSIVIGLANILSGYVLKAVNEFKEGNRLAFASEVNWIVFLIALVSWILLTTINPALITLPLTVMASTVVGFFVINEARGIAGKILTGFGKIYSLISFGADILSFTRLVAVGLTGGIIASVINLLAILVYNSIPVFGLNVLAFVVVLIAGHLFNLIISLFGAYINPLRLHYVEFLPKFYDAKGEKLVTLNTDFKYLKLIN